MGKSKKNNSEIIGEAFGNFLKEKAKQQETPIVTTPVNQLNLGLIQEEYSGMFEKDLKEILHDSPLTFENLHKALRDNKLACAQIQRILQKIKSNQEKIDYIHKLFLNCKEAENELSYYASKKFIHPRFTRDKYYLDLKESISTSKKYLKEKYHVKDNKDMQKKIDHSKKRMPLIGKLNKLHRLKLQERSLLVLSIKKLAKKVRGNIASLHPELAQYVDFLSFEQLSNLKTLSEQFKFSPKSTKDFTREIRECKLAMKKDPANKEYYKTKMKLLDSVSSELHRNIEHAKNLEKGYTHEKTSDLTIDYGNPYGNSY